MRMPFALAMLLTCAGCSQEDTPAEQVAEVAEEVVAPSAEPAPLAKGDWAPRDECADAEGAAEFRERLAAAVEARDADALVALAADDIKLDFGGGEGTAELRALLADSGLWHELELLMALGCAANDEGGITIPWYFDQNMGVTDPYAVMLVMGEDVPVYAGAFRYRERDNELVGTISWGLLEISSFDAEPRQQIELPNGTVGFIDNDKLRDVIGYRLIASSRNGRWRITSLLAGD